MMHRTTTNEESTCYTYEIKMVVQVIADSKEAADAKVDQQGGHITYRSVDLVDSAPLFNRIEGSLDES